MQVEASTDADVVSGTVTSTTPPAKDKGAYTVTEKKKEVAYKEIKTEVTTPAEQEGKNVTTSGFSKQPIFVHEEFKTGSPIVLKHKPSKIILVRAYTTQYRNGIFAVEIFPPSGPAGGSQHFGYGKRDSYTINEKTLTIEEKFFTYDGKPRGARKGLRFKVAYEYLGNYHPSWRVKQE